MNRLLRPGQLSAVVLPAHRWPRGERTCSSPSGDDRGRRFLAVVEYCVSAAGGRAETALPIALTGRRPIALRWRRRPRTPDPTDIEINGVSSITHAAPGINATLFRSRPRLNEAMVVIRSAVTQISGDRQGIFLERVRSGPAGSTPAVSSGMAPAGRRLAASRGWRPPGRRDLAGRWLRAAAYVAVGLSFRPFATTAAGAVLMAAIAIVAAAGVMTRSLPRPDRRAACVSPSAPSPAGLLFRAVTADGLSQADMFGICPNDHMPAGCERMTDRR
jgi:hypothetical protein